MSSKTTWMWIAIVALTCGQIGRCTNQTNRDRLNHVESCLEASVSKDECDAIWYVTKEMKR